MSVQKMKLQRTCFWAILTMLSELRIKNISTDYKLALLGKKNHALNIFLSKANNTLTFKFSG